jgi:hypothetical protein
MASLMPALARAARRVAERVAPSVLRARRRRRSLSAEKEKADGVLDRQWAAVAADLALAVATLVNCAAGGGAVAIRFWADRGGCSVVASLERIADAGGSADAQAAAASMQVTLENAGVPFHDHCEADVTRIDWDDDREDSAQLHSDAGTAADSRTGANEYADGKTDALDDDGARAGAALHALLDKMGGGGAPVTVWTAADGEPHQRLACLEPGPWRNAQRIVLKPRPGKQHKEATVVDKTACRRVVLGCPPDYTPRKVFLRSAKAERGIWIAGDDDAPRLHIECKSTEERDVLAGALRVWMLA